MARRGRLSRQSAAEQQKLLSGMKLLIALALAVSALCLVFGSATAQNAEKVTKSTTSKAVPTAGMPASKVDEQPATQDTTNSLDNPSFTPSEKQSVGVKDLVVRFIDVGQGDCALVTCSGESMLIDGGSSSSSSKIYSILEDLGIPHLNIIVVTHPDADHCAGVAGALKFASCDTCYCSINVSDTKTFDNLIKQLNKQGTAITVPSCGDSFVLGGSICTFVGPTRDLKDDNNNSLIMRLEYGDTSFLFAADAESEAEQSLLASGALQPADVLKVAHHGSSSSSSSSFLEMVKPCYAIVSVGKNSYGHPSPIVLDRLKALSCETLRTDEVGSIVIQSDGKNLSVKTVKGKLHE